MRFLTRQGRPRRSRRKNKGLSSEFHDSQTCQAHAHGPHPVPTKFAFLRDGEIVRLGKKKQNKRGNTGNELKKSGHGIRDGACYAEAEPDHGGVRIKAWAARRRNPRVNGADLYVARRIKQQIGAGVTANARPCWRCIGWCKWAGVKRIFHWNEELGKFEMIKVNACAMDFYETQSDARLAAGRVSGFADCQRLCWG